MSNRKNKRRDERRVRVRAIRRDPPDLRKLAHALIDLAQAEAEAQAQAEHERHQLQAQTVRPAKPKSTTPATNSSSTTRPPSGDAA